MKIKYNIPKLNEIKEKFNNLKNKIQTKKEGEIKTPGKYYIVLVLMLVLAVITFSRNIKEYSKSKEENYIKYSIKNEDENVIIASNDKTYITNESSISTSIPNLEETVETISKNIDNDYTYPVKGKEIIKEYAENKLIYSKTLDMWKTHPGIDIKADVDEQVKSICDGKVVEIAKEDFYGNVVKIQDDKGYTYVYGNLDNNIEVKEEDTVSKGQVIGYVGVSAEGEILDESHLHFEVIKDNAYINPVEILNLSE